MEKTLSHAHQAIVIHSPYSGRSRELPEAIAYLRQLGVDIVSSVPISSLDGLPPQGPLWREQGIDMAVAAGGDGLAGGTITHIVESGLSLGILPLGTANDIARSLGIPQNPRQAAEVIACGKEIQVDVGVAHPAEQAPHPPAAITEAERHPHQPSPWKHGYFAHALTVGVNVQFAQLATNIATRQRYGSLTYPITALEVLRNHTALDMQFRFVGLVLPAESSSISSPARIISQEAATLHCRTLLAAVINAPIFGGALQLSIPGSQVNDRLLDIVIIEDVDTEHLNTVIERIFSPRIQPALYQREQATTLQKAELINIPGLHHIQAQGVIITTNFDPQDVTLDGEIRGRTPIYVRMADEQMRVAVPQ